MFSGRPDLTLISGALQAAFGACFCPEVEDDVHWISDAVEASDVASWFDSEAVISLVLNDGIGFATSRAAIASGDAGSVVSGTQDFCMGTMEKGDGVTVDAFSEVPTANVEVSESLRLLKAVPRSGSLSLELTSSVRLSIRVSVGITAVSALFVSVDLDCEVVKVGGMDGLKTVRYRSLEIGKENFASGVQVIVFEPDASRAAAAAATSRASAAPLGV